MKLLCPHLGLGRPSLRGFFLLFCGLEGFCQTPQLPFSFKKFVDDEGTLSNIINCMMEDKDSFLWMGSTNGLKRFDGKNFTIFKHENNNPSSLPHSIVMTLCEDKSGKIWVGTGEGIGYFDKKTNKFFNLKETNKNDFVCFNILCDSKNNIWFSLRGKGLYKYSETTKKIEHFVNNPKDKTSIKDDWIERKGMILDPLGRGLWIITDLGFNFFDFTSKQFYNSNNNPQNLPILNLKYVSGLSLDEKTMLYFDIGSQKIVYYDVKKHSISKEISVKKDLKKENTAIRNIYVDRQHNLWLSDYYDFCYFFDSKTNKFFRLTNDPLKQTTIAANAFWCAYQQHDDTIWLGTNDGISITNPLHSFFEIYDLSLQYPKLKDENQLYHFLEDGIDSTWWLAATNQSFVHYFPKTNHLETFDIPKNPMFVNPKIIDLIEYKNGIFVVSTKSFYFFDKQKKQLQKLELPEKTIVKNHISHSMLKGDSIWFFGHKPFVYSYKIATRKWTFYPINTVSEEREISCSETDNNGNIWISIPKVGLATFSTKSQAFELQKLAKESRFENEWQKVFRKNSKGNFWIGSFYELEEFDPISKKYTHSIDVDIIADVLVDKEDNIWTATYNDITVYFPKIQKTLFEQIPINKGNFNLNWRKSLFSLKNGQIITLVRGNVVKIDPKKLVQNSINDKVLISKMNFVDEEILVHSQATNINLVASKNSFGIYFSVLNSPGLQKYDYSYQLLGLNNEWVSTKNNFAAFSNLEGGNYVFNVRGIDSFGHETAINSLKIHIETLFYKSKWFLYFCVFSALALIYAFVKFRSNQRTKIHQLQVKSTSLEKDKTEIQYQNLINHLNPHFLFNSLTSLKSLIKTKPKDAADFLQKLSLIYRYILQNKDKDVVSLEQEIAFVRNYIDLQKSRFEEGLVINIDIEEEYLSAGIVPVTLQNLFENAIKHNTLEEDKPLIINVLIEKNCLIVKNNLQKKAFVETSNKQGLESLKNLYKYLTSKPLETIETESEFLVKVPLL